MGLIKTGIQLAGAYGLLKAGSKYVIDSCIIAGRQIFILILHP